MDVITFGCAVAQAESEMIKGLLVESGLDLADVTVVNTCTVKSPTETKILRLLRKLETENRKVVVAGCIPAARPQVAEEFSAFSFIGVNVKDVVEAVKAAGSGGRYVNIAESGDKSCLPRNRLNPIVGILPIAEGCLGGCSFCQTKNARGRLRSYPQRKLKKEAEDMVRDGVKEIWVTAQDTGAYGADTGTSLPELLDSLTDVDGEFRIRVGMMNPDLALSMLDEIVEAYGHRKIYKFLHLPVQSGDDRVLRDMNRRYTVDEFKEVVEAFRKHNTTLSTDVIVGYPTEGEEAFQNTIDLLEEIKPDVLNSTRYWPRPDTSAANLKQLPGAEVKRRSRIVGEAFKKAGLERNKRWVGWEGEVILSEKNTDGTFTGRNEWYKPIIVKGGKIGECSEVEVKKATYYDLRT
ncbi:MAG: tRNA (N(6)-L-threonylcarbamoyladenosine(37)-C(2))-methylthiotransferase [Candidatus Altiarchaeota archaeon]